MSGITDAVLARLGFTQNSAHIYSMARDGETIAPTTEYAGLWIDTAGDVICTPIDSVSAITLIGVPAGTMLPIHVSSVASVAGVAAGVCTSIGFIP